MILNITFFRNVMASRERERERERERFISVLEEITVYVFREDLNTVQAQLKGNMSASSNCFTVNFMIKFDSLTLQTSTIN